MLANGNWQISELAIFGECVGVVAWIPAVVALLLFSLGYALRPLWRRRPIWLRTFAAEGAEESDGLTSAGLGSPIPKSWNTATILLFLNSLLGLVLCILASLKRETGPLFLTPLIPHVSGSQTAYC